MLEAADQQGVETVIDTPGKAADVSISATKTAHLVLVPLRPSIADIETLWAVRDREARREVEAFRLPGLS